MMTTAYHDYEKGLNSYAFWKTRDHEIGEDMVQDSFMKTWKYLAKGGKIDVMKSFLYHVLNNLIVDNYRKHKSISLETLLEKGLEPGADNSDRMMNVLDGNTAMALIERLPEKYRRVMRMRYAQDMSLHEISMITGQTKNAIAVQLHRGLEKLKILHNRA